MRFLEERSLFPWRSGRTNELVAILQGDHLPETDLTEATENVRGDLYGRFTGGAELPQLGKIGSKQSYSTEASGSNPLIGRRPAAKMPARIRVAIDGAGPTRWDRTRDGRVVRTFPAASRRLGIMCLVSQVRPATSYATNSRHYPLSLGQNGLSRTIWKRRLDYRSYVTQSNTAS
jgi:hypothetical protein